MVLTIKCIKNDYLTVTRMATISSISDSATKPKPPLIVYDNYLTPKSENEMGVQIQDRTVHQRMGDRFNNDAMMDTTVGGHKDRFNTRLTAPNLGVHYLPSDKIGNLNHGDHRRGIHEMFAYDTPLRTTSRPDQYGPDSFVPPSSSMKKMVTIYDSSHPINAMPSKNFNSGGTDTVQRPQEHLGKGGALPQPFASNLTSQGGVDFTFFTSHPDKSENNTDFSHFEKKAKENFVKRMSEHSLVLQK